MASDPSDRTAAKRIEAAIERDLVADERDLAADIRDMEAEAREHAASVAPSNEARSRLTAVLSVCDHERAALEQLGDPELTLIIERMREFRLDVVAALTGLQGPATDESAEN